MGQSANTGGPSWWQTEGRSQYTQGQGSWAEEPVSWKSELSGTWNSVKALENFLCAGMHFMHQYRLGDSWREQLCREGPEGSGGP